MAAKLPDLSLPFSFFLLHFGLRSTRRERGKKSQRQSYCSKRPTCTSKLGANAKEKGCRCESSCTFWNSSSTSHRMLVGLGDQQKSKLAMPTIKQEKKGKSNNTKQMEDIPPL